MNKEFKTIANSVDVSEAPDKIKILPLGYVKSQKGDFIVNGQDFDKINKQFKGRKIDLVIDYEHQTLHDIQAPAAGWIKQLALEEDGIYATVEWNKKAKQYIENKEYRYLSPVVKVGADDNHVKVLHSVALTNTPAIDGMKAIINNMKGDMASVEKNQAPSKEEDECVKRFSQLLKKIVNELGLTMESTILEMIAKLEKSDEKDYEQELQALKWNGQSKRAESENLVQMALSTGRIDENQRAWALNCCEADLEGFRYYVNKGVREECEKAVEIALNTGKIAPFQKEWAEKLAFKDLTAFKEFTQLALPVVPMGQIIADYDIKNKSTGADNSRINELLGISREQVDKYNA